MNRHPGLLSTADEISELARVLENHSIIAFDTEFIRESTFFPIVEIIQVATDSESWLVDAQAFKRGYKSGDPDAFDPGLTPLLKIFANKNILKVVHAAQGDQECIYTSFGTVASPTIDTAVAASLCGYGDGIGLGKLLKMILNVSLAKGHARTNWSVRPLPEQLVAYAHADVEHLVELGSTLLGHLDQMGRKSWALELSAKWENAALYQADIEGLTQKLARGGRLDKKGYSALLGLVKWREERVRQLNLPRRWVADDHVLLDLAHVRPKDLAHLSTFRGLNKGELKNSGEAILAAMNAHGESEDIVMPKMPKPSIPSQEEAQVLDLLRCFVGILADQHKIAAKHLMTAAQLLPLLRTSVEKPEDLSRAGILSEDAARLIGEELIAMIQGKRALVVRGSQIEIISTPTQASSHAKK
jgi:ribonuclease D